MLGGQGKGKTVNKKNITLFKTLIDKMHQEKLELDRVSESAT